MSRAEFLTRWEQRRAVFAECGDTTRTRLIDLFLTELATLVRDEADTLLTLQHAARLSGYTQDHLGLLLRQGKIPNVGRKGAPRIRVGDLPRKPYSNVVSALKSGYDINADVRSLRSRRHQ